MLSLFKNFLKKKKLFNHKIKLEQICLMGENFCSSPIYSQNTNNFQLLSVKINNLTGDKKNVKIGNNCNLSLDLFLNKKGSVSIGSYVYMNSVIARIDYDLRIGSHCMFGPNVKLWDTNNHQLNVQERIKETIKIAEKGFLDSYEAGGGSIVIGNNVWIGMDVTILGPVTIGEGSVIGAGSLVIKNIPSNSFAAGTPAKVIKKIG